MSRPIWKGSISFGLVSIPVELHSAVRDHRPRFRLLCSGDSSTVKYDRVCERDGRPVSWEDLLKGYEYEKGKFVILNKEDFQAAAVEKSKRIDILEFVRKDEVDDRYFEASYYLVPTQGGERAYALLRESIRRSGKMGVGKVILRENQHLAALTAVGDALILTLMRFGDEVIDAGKFSFPAGKDVRAKELGLANSLIEGLSGEWSPEKYVDEHRANLVKIIEAKIKDASPELEREVPAHEASVVDLMERLRQSLQGRGGAKPKRRATPRKGAGKKARKKGARRVA